MDETEAISIANRAHAKKRWAKTEAKQRQQTGRRMADLREQKRVTLPRLQDTRTSQVLGNDDVGDGVSQSIDIWQRVSRRMKESGTTARFWNRKVQEYATTLEEFAKDFYAVGQPEKAVQILMVLLKHTKELCVPEGPLDMADQSAAEAAYEARLSTMSDEELRQQLKEPEQPS
jgi:hypothetical protein